MSSNNHMIHLIAWMSKLPSTKIYLSAMVFLFSSSFLRVSGQLYINEFSASNAAIIEDPDYLDDADWIELYNAGNVAINLKDYYLTDDLGEPSKWKIENNTFIDAHDYLIIWADGTDNGIHSSFKLSADGEEIGLFDPDQKVVDSISYAYQQTDISFGRNLTSISEWGYFQQPTPNGPNTTPFYKGLALNSPEIRPAGGLFQGSLYIDMSTNQGGTIRYTLDGSVPTLSSPFFTSPLFISSTTLIRARIFKPDSIPGPIVTHSYFLDEDLEERKLPVISIATDSENFWDQAKGIYVQDFKPDWEIPVNIELFEVNGTDRAEFNEQAGIKINGLYSWQLPQKMLGVYFRNQYGSGKLNYPIITNTYRNRYDNFALRASGSDWSYTLFRDILGQDAAKLNMDLDISSFRPCIVFVNGSYMGIHNIREKIESNYIEENHNLDQGTFDMVENEDYPEAGDLVQYHALQELLSADLSIQSNYEKVAGKMDIENFTDLVILEMAVANTSIGHNVMAWKPKTSGKWKWIVMDLDRGFFNPSQNLINFYLGQDVWPFKELFENESYKAYFGKKLADHLYTSFHPDQMIKLIGQHQREIESEIPNHIQRWLGTTSSYGNAMPSIEYWYNEVCDIESFVRERPVALLSDLQSYGFDQASRLSLAISPPVAGDLYMNGLLIPGTDWSAPYPTNLAAQINASDRPGYVFAGWKNTYPQIILPKGSDWKYLDNGADLGTAWREPSYNDESWKSGPGQLGYGDGDENTIVSYGPNSQNKYITTYFRRSFLLDDQGIDASQFTINLMADDGAIVYLNGNEVLKDNMGCGDIDYLTTASSAIGGQAESAYISYNIDRSFLKPGNNVLAVEIHQYAPNSSDISFDMEVIAYYEDENAGYLSTDRNLDISLTGDLMLKAVFEPTGECVLPAIVQADMVLEKSCSPYLVQGDVTIMPDATLSIEPGVEVYMFPNATIFIHGKMSASGTESERIIFKINPAFQGKSWGALNFENSLETSNLAFVTIRDADKGPNPVRVGAISAYHADLNLDHMVIDQVFDNPISSRYSDIALTNSSLHSEVTGDLINVKYGKARIENCEFSGPEFLEDVDAIDFDDVKDGIIRNCKIYNFTGLNNDGVDIGERSSNILIDSVQFFQVFDKGISIGQQSTAAIKNCSFINCNIGIGAKDSSRVHIDHCLFYSTGWPVKCFEKNPGSAGGNAVITNSILSNSSEASFFADSRSKLNISYSISDNEALPDNGSNLFGNPRFSKPTLFDFELEEDSPCLMAGNDSGSTSDLGVRLPPFDQEPSILINRIFINSEKEAYPEFITLYNPSGTVRDLSGYSISKGVTCLIPEGIYLYPNEMLFLTNDAFSPNWTNNQQLVQWQEGKLSNNGEAIELRDNFGIVIDYLYYTEDGTWPAGAFTKGDILELKDPNTDNHFGEHWMAIPVEQVFTKTKNLVINDELMIYPNPSGGKVSFFNPEKENTLIEVYSILGCLLDQLRVDTDGNTPVDISIYVQPVLLIRSGNFVQKIVLID